MLGIVSAALLSAASFDAEVAFGRLPFIDDVEVSPSGERIAARFSSNGQTGLLIFELSDSRIPNRLIEESENLKVRRFFWKRDDRLVFSAAVPGSRYGTATVETRLLAVTPGEQEIKPLFKRQSRAGTELPVQIQDRIVSVLPNDPGHVLVEYFNNSDNASLYLVNVDRRGLHKLVEGARSKSRHFTADMQGNVRARHGFDKGKNNLFLKTPDGKWKNFSHRVADGQPRFQVVGFPNIRSKAFVLSDHETPTTALYVFNIETDQFESLLFQHPFSDVTGVRQRLSDGKAYGALFAEDERHVHYFGENLIKDLTDYIKERLDTDNVSFNGINPQETMAVFWVAPQGRPGQYYIINTKSLQLIQ
ncbi:MAG: hypothetical protein AAF225_13185, partial [Pseudomonadota bacterium]